VLWVWIAFALFPTALASATQSPVAPPDQREIVRHAAIDTAILLPVLVFAMTLAVPAVVLIVLTVTAMLRQHSLASGRRVALALLLGNLLGGANGSCRLRPLERGADNRLSDDPSPSHRPAVRPADRARRGRCAAVRYRLGHLPDRLWHGRSAAV
jgi:hypothetical protein